MSNASSTKKYFASTPEVAKMLNLGGFSEGAVLPEGELPGAADLPVADTNPENAAATQPAQSERETAEEAKDAATEKHPVESQNGKITKIAKVVLPYVVVFGVGVFLYFFFFKGIDFSSIFKAKNSGSSVAQVKESEIEKLEKQELNAYYKWIEGYYYEVTDSKILDPEADNSGNGLTNFQKYLLGLNPKAYGTLNANVADSQLLAAGIYPASGLALNSEQKDLVDKYIDMEVVMNKLALSHLSNTAQVAGVSTSTIASLLGSGLISQTGTNSAGQAESFPKADILTPSTDTEVDINTSVAGRLEIPELNINVPIIWTQDTKNFSADLQKGVVHYPGTALPGQIGTTYISGHSSNYAWAKGDYNKVFSTLGDLAENTSFKITVVQTNGKDAIFHYVVTGKKQYSATDQEQFKNTGKSIVALSTCWPVGSTAKRLVVFGELTQVEK